MASVNRVLLQSTYVLHARPFRDTSLLVDFFTRTHGKITAVARGARTQRSKFRGLLQAFVPLVISWSGRSELVTLHDAEPSGPAFDFSGKALISGIYLNELLQRLMAKHDPHVELFEYYQQCLTNMQKDDCVLASVLREFEKQLLVELGYGFDWRSTADTNETICAGQWYVFQPDQGFLSAKTAAANCLAFQGEHIIAIANNDWCDSGVTRAAKQLMRAALNPLLQGKPIRSRELFS